MSQLVQNQNPYPNPFSYFANTPKSITFRKNKASRPSSMKIINFTKYNDGSFIVSIKGVRGITYQVFFSDQEISCDCPDFQKHSVKPICKHMFKLICLSENNDIFNNSMLLSDLMNPLYLRRILDNIMRIIDIKKMERYGNPQNQISIERDDCCSICYGDFDTDIAECLKCKHVFHQTCIRLSWNSASYLSRGKCPMCRAANSFPQFGGFNNEDPWEIYNFPPPPAEPVPVPVIEEVPAPEPEEVLFDIIITNPPFGNPNQQLIEEPAQQDILIVNPEENVLDNPIIPSEPEQNEGAIVQNQLFFPVSNDIPAISFENGGDENSNPNPNPNPNPNHSITDQASEESAPSLSQQQEYDIIDTRMKILNISLFILNTINIIVNHISSDLSLNPKPE